MSESEDRKENHTRPETRLPTKGSSSDLHLPYPSTGIVMQVPLLRLQCGKFRSHAALLAQSFSNPLVLCRRQQLRLGYVPSTIDLTTLYNIG